MNNAYKVRILNEVKQGNRPEYMQNGVYIFEIGHVNDTYVSGSVYSEPLNSVISHYGIHKIMKKKNGRAYIMAYQKQFYLDFIMPGFDEIDYTDLSRELEHYQKLISDMEQGCAEGYRERFEDGYRKAEKNLLDAIREKCGAISEVQ